MGDRYGATEPRAPAAFGRIAAVTALAGAREDEAASPNPGGGERLTLTALCFALVFRLFVSKDSSRTGARLAEGGPGSPGGGAGGEAAM